MSLLRNRINRAKDYFHAFKGHNLNNRRFYPQIKSSRRLSKAELKKIKLKISKKREWKKRKKKKELKRKKIRVRMRMRVQSNKK